jgi:uncharacterized protein (TIGR03118 family)
MLPCLEKLCCNEGNDADDVAGSGNGFVNVFNTSGNFLRRLVSNGNLNAPWGLALVEADELWVGNFGDGTINNYNPTTGAFLGTISHADNTPLQIDGLWDLLPLTFGTSTAVYFTAGIADEEHGLFGRLKTRSSGEIEHRRLPSADDGPRCK